MNKKLFIIVFLLLVIFGCGKEVTTDTKEEEEPIVVKKIKELEDYLYFDDYKSFNMDGLDIYKLDIPVINIDNSNISSVNTEIKSFILSSVNDYIIKNDVFIKGRYITYDYYINKEYVSLLIKFSNYYNGSFEGENVLVYNIDLKNGVNIDNKSLLKSFLIDENELPMVIRNKLDSEDVEYSVTSMKNEYYLYIDNDSKLHLLFFERNDEEQIKRDLIIN
ncbi:MAG: hypothetical protein IKQ29_01790 [Bacilli bacterium]|nr:hypothetical protein [Bacilli bacterium]